MNVFGNLAHRYIHKYLKHLKHKNDVGGLFIMSLFRMLTTEGTNVFLYPFFLASGALNLLLDGSSWNDK